MRTLIRKIKQLKDPRLEYPDKITMSEVADAMADLLAFGWTQGAAARDIYGHEVSFKSKKAVKYSSNGAIDFILYKYGSIKKVDKEAWLIRFTIYVINNIDTKKWSAFNPEDYPGGYRLFLWNDHEHQTQDQVIKAFRDFAERLRNNDSDNNLVWKF